MATSRTRVPLTVVLTMITVFVVGAGLGVLSGPLELPRWLFGPPGQPGAALAPSQPTRIEIPSLGVSAKVHPVGLDRDGAIAAPPMRRAHEAGWYEDGPSPGQFGPAVLVGHVDDESSPAIFHDLVDLRPGARIEITRRDRKVVAFEVTDVRSYDKTNLPADEVYGDFSRPGLRLITCGGRWLGGQTGYADNIVVFATLAGSVPGDRNSAQRGSAAR